MRMKECTDTVEIIMELEGGELVIEDKKDLERLKNLCREFAYSQGFYGRLLRDIEDAEELGNIEFPIVM